MYSLRHLSANTFASHNVSKTSTLSSSSLSFPLKLSIASILPGAAWLAPLNQGQLAPTSLRQKPTILFGVPSDTASLERDDVLVDDDFD